MHPIVKAAFAYTLPVFIFAFVVGAVRVTLIAPVLGPLLAVALEVPLVLAVSWAVAGRVLMHWPLRDQRPALALLSFAILMALELGTALAFDQTAAQFLTAMTTPAGALGLAGQIGFALIPLVRQPRG
jgi:hypothetical protein